MNVYYVKVKLSRESERVTIKRTVLFLSSILSLSLLLACNNQQNSEISMENELATTNVFPELPASDPTGTGGILSQFPESDISESISIDSVNYTPFVRAKTYTEQGTLLMVSNGREELGHLIVSSVMGVEGDRTFHSNYSIVYRQDNQDKVLLNLPALLYIQPSDKLLSFDKISFKEADVYLLTPQYQTGHGLECYAVAINKMSGDAFSLKFIRKGYVFEKLVYSEKQIPFNQNERLVVHPAVGAGTPEEDTKEIHYKLDLANRQFIAE
ncbi:hypothetical protein SAMN04487895_102349 [Paenibacillus sophorae]|nr:hypothetical protein SAMN04487895_102349 [Paenibacillus sophorae]